MSKSLVERIFPRSVERITSRKAAEMRIAEAQSQDPEWAFQKIGSGTDDVPPGFVAHVVRESKRMYESHGLGWRIIERMITIMYEGGYSFDVKFAEGTPQEYQSAIRKVLDDFWYNEGVDIQDRARELVLQTLLAGEHGWKFSVDANGRVAIGDVSRDDVVDISVDGFDTRKLVSVQVRAERLGNVEDLPVIRKTDSKHLEGACMYLRIGSRAKKYRGTPFLQRLVDELAAEKKFRVLAGDRVLDRMTVVMLTTVTGMNIDDLEKYKKTQGTRLPTNRRVYQTDQVKNEFASANMEAGDVAQMIRTWITVIAGMLGWPISWFGFGDGSTKATSETQQGPAEMDSNQMKTMFVRFLERLLYFVVDQAIMHDRIDATSVPNKLKTVAVKIGDKGQILPLRECVTINVSTVPLVDTKPQGAPLAATTAAADLVGKLVLIKSETGEDTVSSDDVVTLLNHAFATDGVGIELAKNTAAS